MRPVLLLSSCAAWIAATGPALALDEIVLRSGNAAIGSPDPAITFLAAPNANSAFPAPFTAADFAAARAGPNAHVVTGPGAWFTFPEVGPSVQYISDDPDTFVADSALYAIDFTIPQASWQFASLSLRFRVDNHLGDTPSPGTGLNPEGVYLNGQPLAGFPPGGFGPLVNQGCADITSVLVPGLNTLYLYQFDWGSHAGLAFEARIEYAVSGVLGTAYCTPASTNSTGVPGIIGAYGSSVVANDDLTLFACQLPAGEFGYFLVSQNTGTAIPPGSAGTICLVGGDIGRFNAQGQIIPASACGTIQLELDVGVLPMNPPVSAMPGETWNFQCWYRDGSTNNFTDAVSVQFL